IPITNRQIEPSWSELFVIVNPSVISCRHIVDITTMPPGDYGSYPCVILTIVASKNKIAHTILALRAALCWYPKVFRFPHIFTYWQIFLHLYRKIVQQFR
ncbi:unnamed protein product, partial [Hymenolepis diminuta]